jgi:hypothetical protein
LVAIALVSADPGRDIYGLKLIKIGSIIFGK